ncbi:methyl-accepting chemotaxis protein [Bdellovibrio sp. KM01]|uniref:methyl-accepting chemotaxis protein n=1 Tax=Bdellovibrio sp. KM01 TaxID=2748865 RepID=UPI0015E9567A|nr:methyl-accepting chemotaxis protein [Bdellovibrio sp. KM01]QLY25232.1 MCP four helix bundle domain-containing protein [Bdellovibrio sp. KM01]
MKMSLKAKLFALCIFMAAIPIVVGGVAFWGIQGIGRSYEKVTGDVLGNIEVADKMYLHFRSIRISLRSLGLPGLSHEQGLQYVKEVTDSIAAYEKADEIYRSYAFLPGEKEKYEEVNSTWVAFKSLGADALKLYLSGTNEDKQKLINIFLVDCPKYAAAYDKAIASLVSFHHINGETWVNEARNTGKETNTTVLVTILFGVILGMVCGAWVAISLAKSIAHVSEEIANGAEQVKHASEKITESSQALSSASSQQAASLEETVATIEELTAMVKTNSENAKQAANLAKSTRESAVQGERDIRGLITSIQIISSDSKKIADITSVIDDIAFQTNLLALNAAVEAARAGEQGRGFAVVADAVRSLAQRSAESAKSIAALINESVERIEEGSAKAEESGIVFSEIVTSIKKIADLSGEISTASQEQANGIVQMGKAMNDLDQVTQQNAAASEEAAASAQQLAGQAQQLRANVDDLDRIVAGRVAAPEAVDETEKALPLSQPVRFAS